MTVILRCTFEELNALTAGAEGVISTSGGGGIAAPPEVMTEVEALVPRLTGDITVSTYAQQQKIVRALNAVLEYLQDRMDASILEEHVGAESAVIAYFDYGHVLTVLDRATRLGAEMEAMIELMTGEAPTFESARAIAFPD